MDGASSKAGNGAGAVLISPTVEKVKIAVILNLRVTNNEAEYENV